MKINIFRLIVSIVICQLAGVAGSVFTYPSIPVWYASLQKPWFTPPSWIFAPVWVTLFLLMGISLYLVWNKGIKGKGVKRALWVFGVQLVLNILWSLIFFGLRNPLYGLAEIIILWVFIAASIILFYRIDKRAGLILLPYIIWVTIASFLNLYIWLLN